MLKTPALALGLLLVMVPGLASAAEPGEAGVPPPVAAAPLPFDNTPEGRKQRLDSLFDRLAVAKNDAEATGIRSDIRQVWQDTGSATIDLLLDRDAQAALAHDAKLRRELLTAAAKLAPGAVEVWNRRAGLDFAEEKFEAAITDLGHVLALEPRHFDALEALGGILKDSGQEALALKAFRRLKEVNPKAGGIDGAITELTRKVEGQGI